MASRPPRTIVVSNRSCLVAERIGLEVRVERTVGGVPGTLEDLMTRSGGTWIAWNGKDGRAPRRLASPSGPCAYDLRFVPLTREQIRGSYLGFANRFLWPLCHGFVDKCAPCPDHWAAYAEVNRAFAGAILDEASPSDTVWVHDYHLGLVPRLARRAAGAMRLGFFWHIPFPAPDLYLLNPWGRDMLEGLLGSDLIGFHCQGSVDNFLDCVALLTGHDVDRASSSVAVGGRVVRVRALPLGIDVERIEALAGSAAVRREAAAIRRRFNGQRIALSVERLDYTKGVVERFEALGDLFAQHPDLRGRWSALQIAAPGRMEIGAYREVGREVQNLAARINAAFGTPDWRPITLVMRPLERPEVVAHYMAADIGVVTPLNDGMNLVAKEFAATPRQGAGALVLSRFAGAADELGEDAILVDPFDRTDLTAGIMCGMTMDEAVGRARAARLRERVRRRDLAWWSRRLDRELRFASRVAQPRPEELTA